MTIVDRSKWQWYLAGSQTQEHGPTVTLSVRTRLHGHEVGLHVDLAVDAEAFLTIADLLVPVPELPGYLGGVLCEETTENAQRLIGCIVDKRRYVQARIGLISAFETAVATTEALYGTPAP